jgi:glycine/D-amino acid oxidase-like deaminating enzyme
MWNMMRTKTNSEPYKIAIVGGGVAGATAALHLGELGLEVLLIERGPTLVNGPPICHLHAGGNLYREISQQQCLELLRQSIETFRLYPHTLNKRPTVIATPHSDAGDPNALLSRLEQIRSAYAQLVESDPLNQVLGEPAHYFQLYNRVELDNLAKQTQTMNPMTFDDWLIPFAQHADLNELKFPVIAVQEFGWSVFRLAASATLALEKLTNCKIMTNSQLIGTESIDNGWRLTYLDSSNEQQHAHVDYLINACGYETGLLDDMTQNKRKRLVEFKAAYVTHWPDCQQLWPEVIFHGPRGTPQGMAQLTPYADGVFQLHGMAEGITLFSDGLVESTEGSSQPQLPAYLQSKITTGWTDEATRSRSVRAIEHLSQFIPSYHSATVSSKPLFGAQQIPGSDSTLRAADVSFSAGNYARIEIVKGSSALEAARKIVTHWSLINSADRGERSIETLHPVSMSLSAAEIEEKAIKLAQEREYPMALATVVGMR